MLCLASDLVGVVFAGRSFGSHFHIAFVRLYGSWLTFVVGNACGFGGRFVYFIVALVSSRKAFVVPPFLGPDCGVDTIVFAWDAFVVKMEFEMRMQLG